MCSDHWKLWLQLVACVHSGCGGEADPVSQRDPSETDQQPERRAGHQGETHHRASGVRPTTSAQIFSLQTIRVRWRWCCYWCVAVWTRRSCWSKRGWGWSTRSSRLSTRRRAASFKSSRKALMCSCTLLLVIPYALSIIHMMFCRVQQDRREQARQDLKGLEETVVSYWQILE